MFAIFYPASSMCEFHNQLGHASLEPKEIWKRKSMNKLRVRVMVRVRVGFYLQWTEVNVCYFLSCFEHVLISQPIRPCKNSPLFGNSFQLME